MTSGVLAGMISTSIVNSGSQTYRTRDAGVSEKVNSGAEGKRHVTL